MAASPAAVAIDFTVAFDGLYSAVSGMTHDATALPATDAPIVIIVIIIVIVAAMGWIAIIRVILDWIVRGVWRHDQVYIYSCICNLWLGEQNAANSCAY